MTRTMADTIASTVGDITALEAHQPIDMVAGYANGLYAWTAADWARFPNQAHVTIDVRGTDIGADVLDVESGDATPADSVTWVRNKLLQKPGYPPVLYVNRSNITQVFNAQNAAGHQVGRDFRLWIATLDGTKSVPDMTGVTAIQYASAAMTKTNVDLSIVVDGAWKATAKPPVPTPPPVKLPVPSISQVDADRIAGSVLYMLRFLDPSVALPTGEDVDSKLIASAATELRNLLKAHSDAMVTLWTEKINKVLSELKLPPIQ